MELITLPPSHDLSMQDIIPFAAIVLEYPVAYVPVSYEQSDFLPWEVLDVYECVLNLEDERAFRTEKIEHIVCKFSCPNNLVRHSDLQISRMRDRLQALFKGRLLEAGIEGQLDIRHHQETHERVAL